MRMRAAVFCGFFTTTEPTTRMRATTLLRIMFVLKLTRVTRASTGPFGIVATVAPATRVPICSGCMCRARSAYDRDRREWRHLDASGMETTLLYDLRRVDCRRCGVRTELVPWADTGSRFTRDFEDHVAYLAQGTDRTTVATTMRIAWRTVGSIVARVVARLRSGDSLDGLEHIGVDELSYRKHHEYITVVLDHGAGRVVWAAPGKNAATLKEFFAALGAARSAKLKTVTMDMSQAYINAVHACAPNARIVFDRFHVQRLAHDALDEVRRDQMRKLAGTDEGKSIKKTRWALHKNPWNLTGLEHDKVAQVQRANRPLYRAYLLKESLAGILGRRQLHVARAKLHEWIAWGRHDRDCPRSRSSRRRSADTSMASSVTSRPASATAPSRASTERSERSLAEPTAFTTPPTSLPSSSSAALGSSCVRSSRRPFHTHTNVRRALYSHHCELPPLHGCRLSWVP